MKILGIDPSTKTGYSIITEAGITHTGKIPTPKDYTDLERGIMAAEALEKVIDEHKPDMVVMEDLALNAKFNLATMAIIGTCIRNMLYHKKICWYDVPPKVLKLWLTGKGTAKKADMIAHVKRRFGFVTKDDDIADAVALSYLGESMFYEETQAFDQKFLHNATYYTGKSDLIFDKTRQQH